jgi:hypothetical protein
MREMNREQIKKLAAQAENPSPRMARELRKKPLHFGEEE